MTLNKIIISLLIIFFIIYIMMISLCVNNRFTPKTNSKTELVEIDSVSARSKYTFVPDTIWAYHTKYGPTLYSTTNNHKVGDSILINLVTKDSHEQ